MNIFEDPEEMLRPSQATANPLHTNPVKALLHLMKLGMGWRTMPHGLKHEEAQVELVTWNGWITCEFAIDSVERFPMSLWESMRVARAARKLSYRMMMQSLLPGEQPRSLHGALITSMCSCPEDWEVCTDVVHHRPSGIELVTCDGPLFMRCSPMSKASFRLGFLKRLSIWMVTKRLVRRSFADRIYHASRLLSDSISKAKAI